MRKTMLLAVPALAIVLCGLSACYRPATPPQFQKEPVKAGEASKGAAPASAKR